MSATSRRDGGYAKLRSGAHLRAARHKSGLSLRDVAYLARRPASYTLIGRLERGEKRRCSIAFAEAIAVAIGKDFADLFEAVIELPPHRTTLARRRASRAA